MQGWFSAPALVSVQRQPLDPLPICTACLAAEHGERGGIMGWCFLKVPEEPGRHVLCEQRQHRAQQGAGGSCLSPACRGKSKARAASSTGWRAWKGPEGSGSSKPLQGHLPLLSQAVPSPVQAVLEYSQRWDIHVPTLCQGLPTLTGENLFLISNLNLSPVPLLCHSMPCSALL